MTVARPRILCVDDEPGILDFMEKMLFLNGYEVVRAENGKKALDQIKEQGVDLVISDVNMPIVDGFEVCRQIKTDEQLMNIPVILITGYAAKDDRIKGIEAGAEDFLSKPIDSLEVLARIKMLLKVKSINEKRIGELLVDMKFITEQQLREALLISKERNIKVGEALYAMGALERDHIYWVLGNQLKMNYMELSEEMLDADMIGQFPVDLLERLLCLPLYETENEVHFAIADPTDQKTIEEIKRFRPEKTIQLNLALPEKIRSLLERVKRGLSPGRSYRSSPVLARPSSVLPISSLWDDFISFLLSMPTENRFWFYRTPDACRLISQRGDRLEAVQDYSQESCSFIYERIKHQAASQHNGKPHRVFFERKSTGQRGLFHLRRLDGVDKDIILMERIPALSRDDVMASHPQADVLADQVCRLIETYQRLFVASPDGLLLKQCCYLFAQSHQRGVFPPPLFVEEEVQFYFQDVMQLSKDQFDRYDSFRGKLHPFIYYEWGSETAEGERSPWRRFSGKLAGILVSFPFPFAEMEKKGPLAAEGHEAAGFKRFYLDGYDLKPV